MILCSHQYNAQLIFVVVILPVTFYCPSKSTLLTYIDFTSLYLCLLNKNKTVIVFNYDNVIIRSHIITYLPAQIKGKNEHYK